MRLHSLPRFFSAGQQGDGDTRQHTEAIENGNDGGVFLPVPVRAQQHEQADPGIGQQAREQAAKAEHAAVLPICAEIEAEISGMEPEEKKLFLADMGLEESGLDRLIQACYSLLGLISYLTAGKPEVRAWTIKKGTKAPQAAGKIHSDFERGFIRAEVIGFDELMECGTMAAAKEKGLVRSEGKDYVMQDGDIVLFRFNV